MLQELGHVLVTNQVPSLWSAHWSGPEQPLAYCAAVAEKASCLGSWLAALAAGRLWSMPLNLAQLFNPGQHASGMLNRLLSCRTHCAHSATRQD